MRVGSRTASKLLIVIAGAVLGGAVATSATVLTTHPTQAAVIRQKPAIKIVPAPDQYNPAPAKAPVVAPVKLEIPAIGVNSNIERLGVTQDYALEVPQGVTNVGWYRLGATPGAAGDAVITGHRGYPGGIPSVFNSLGRLRAGDAIVVKLEDGTSVNFRVSRTFTTPATKVPDGFFATDGPAKLTLVTCTGDFDQNNLSYSDRLVVEATPVA